MGRSKMHLPATVAVMVAYGVLLVLLVFFLEPEWKCIVCHWLPRLVKNLRY